MDKSVSQETFGRTTKWLSLHILVVVHLKAGETRQEKQKLQKANTGNELLKLVPDLSAVNKLDELRALWREIIFSPASPLAI